VNPAPPEIVILVDDQNRCTEIAGSNGRCQPGAAASGDDDIDVVVPFRFRVAARGVLRPGSVGVEQCGGAETGSA
jgi:hypothetical protein